jgi:hypothetical protein
MSVVAAEIQETPVTLESSPPVPAAPAPGWRVPAWVIVGLLTIFGGALRFSFLDRPPIWGDEAMTFMRVSGTYRQLLERLEDDGFGPLHYQAYWVLRQWRPLTPFMMRLIPAICGTLMIPVMYWLAVQIVPRRTAVIVALFTACSAYLLGYSRDAKMYSDLWLFCALSVATLIWWLRVRTLTSWVCWIAASTAMIGLHLVGAGILAIELLIVLTARPGHWLSLGFLPLGAVAWPVTHGYPLARRIVNRAYVAPSAWPWRWTRDQWRRWCCPPILAFGVGVLFISAGPLGYILYFNRYFQQVDRAGWQRTGIHWVSDYNRGRQGLDLAKYTSTAYLYNWEWPRKFDRPRIDDQASVHRRTLRLLKSAGVALGSLLALALLPWPRKWRGAAVADTTDKQTDRSWWRPALWVAVWLLVPAYAFYVASMRNAASPFQWPVDLLTVSPPKIVWPFVPREETLSATWKLWFETDALGKFFAGWGAAFQEAAGAFSAANVRWWLVAALILFAGSHVFVSATTWRGRLVQIGNFLRVAGTVWLLCLIIFVTFGKPLDGSVWMPRYLGFVWPAFAITVAVLLCRLPTRALRGSAIAFLLLVNLSVFCARVFAQSEPPVDRMAQDLVDSQPNDANVRMYYGIRQQFNGAPGWGLLQLVPGRYYLSITSGQPTTPARMMSGMFQGQLWDKFKRWPRTTLFAIDASIVMDAGDNPRLTRIIVWDKLDKLAVDMNDTLGEQLAARGWKRSGLELFNARDHWTWQELYQVRRRVYERVSPPATPPTTAPSVAPAATTTPTSAPASAPSR